MHVLKYYALGIGIFLNENISGAEFKHIINTKL